ncbi:hypothetical protein FB559_5003 [Actinoallomurus bryophytorum]|uniref:Uncharacterized protein n=1 Tax=Actinoallomurus bryophytorum TaxID=1490222 RepID=A0A543CQI7_9ACTN|nr:hypothetical protein FB559_5003 [Actinoallomurus bryophytorum]
MVSVAALIPQQNPRSPYEPSFRAGHRRSEKSSKPRPAVSPPPAAGYPAKPAALHAGRAALLARGTRGHWPGPLTPAPPPRPAQTGGLFASDNAPAPHRPVPGTSAGAPPVPAGEPADPHVHHHPPPVDRNIGHGPLTPRMDMNSLHSTSRARYGNLPAAGPHPDQPPSSATSSMTRADSPENTVLTRSLRLHRAHRGIATPSVTTERATEPKTVQSPFTWPGTHRSRRMCRATPCGRQQA